MKLRPKRSTTRIRPPNEQPENKGEQKTGDKSEGGNQDSTNAGEKKDQAANNPENQPGESGQSGQSGQAEQSKPNAGDGADDPRAMDDIVKARENEQKQGQSGGEESNEQKQPGGQELTSEENQQNQPGGQGKQNDQKQWQIGRQVPSRTISEGGTKPGGEGKQTQITSQKQQKGHKLQAEQIRDRTNRADRRKAECDRRQIQAQNPSTE